MANPTGTVYLQANNSYVWTDGDVYQIPQTDLAEGAATGASFAGLGVDNQPHQALLNKAQLLHKNQLADEAKIVSLRTALTLTSAVGASGWLKLSSNDVNLGQIYPILQWGLVSLLPYYNTTLPSTFPVNFPIPFPNACWVLIPYFQTSLPSGTLEYVVYPNTPFNVQQNSFSWTSSSGQVMAIANSRGPGLTGISWIAFGY